MHKKISEHYEKNNRQLMHKFGWFCKNAQDGEDCVQDAYERAIKYYDEDNPPLNFDAWFNRILYTAMLDQKKKNFGKSQPEPEDHEEEGIPCQQFDDESVRQIYAMIAEVEDFKDREKLYLYFKYGYGITDIHNIAGGPYVTIEKLIYRFKKRIQEQFNA